MQLVAQNDVAGISAPNCYFLKYRTGFRTISIFHFFPFPILAFASIPPK